MTTGYSALHIGTQRDHDDQRQRRQSRRQGDLEVGAEFVLHLRTLRGAGGDGGVRNKAEVVAEHGAAHDGGDAQRQVKAGIGGHRHGDGGQQGDGADGGAHGHGHEARHHEQHGNRQLHRGDGQQEVGHGLGAGAAGDAHEDARHQEDEDHGDDVLIADALSHQLQLFIKAHTAVLQARYQQRHQEGHDDGDLIEAHFDFQHILQNNAQHQIQHQEYGHGQQGHRPGGWLFLHKLYPL